MFRCKFTVPSLDRAAVSLICFLALFSCTTPEPHYQVKPSPLENKIEDNTSSPVTKNNVVHNEKPSKSVELLQGLSVNPKNIKKLTIDEKFFSNTTKITAAVETMALVDFIHHSFGGVLAASYVISEEIKNLNKTVTLNIQGNISQRDYYRHVKEILISKNAYISFKDDIFYIYPLSETQGQQLAIGIGREFSDVPSTNGKILQIIPLQFGIKLATERTLNQLTKAIIIPDFDQSAIFVQGSRSQVRQVIDLIGVLDRPANRAKQIGFLNLSYISADDFVNKVVVLLENEGIPAGAGSPNQKNVVLVPLTQSGGVAIFASNADFLKRVEAWAQKLDQPPKGTKNQFFIYHPQYARARDLGDSLTPLFGGVNGAQAGNNSRDTKSAVATKRSVSKSVSNDSLKMVVDERANMVIFETSGLRYQSLLPLIKRLDVMPRQVLLEATIAEVTLTDEFAQGVEFNFKDGNFGFSTDGSFGVSDIAGGLLRWTGSLGDAINVKAMQQNSLINVLSNPTLLVRDGTTATITVGEEIPIITSSDTNDVTNRTRTNVERRQTGLTLTVTPTINAEGVVIMEIEQRISNQLTTNANSGSDTILNREIKTEVVANSGQTIILGGLISENNSSGDSQVPLLGRIPLLGNLFKSKSDTKKKTELVILVTPKIIFDEKQWHNIKKKFVLGLENVSF